MMCRTRRERTERWPRGPRTQRHDEAARKPAERAAAWLVGDVEMTTVLLLEGAGAAADLWVYGFADPRVHGWLAGLDGWMDGHKAARWVDPAERTHAETWVEEEALLGGSRHIPGGVVEPERRRAARLRRGSGGSEMMPSRRGGLLYNMRPSVVEEARQSFAMYRVQLCLLSESKSNILLCPSRAEHAIRIQPTLDTP